MWGHCAPDPRSAEIEAPFAGKEEVLHGDLPLVVLCHSVFRRLFRVIDHEDVDRTLRRFQFEPELFLHSGEQ